MSRFNPEELEVQNLQTTYQFLKNMVQRVRSGLAILPQETGELYSVYHLFKNYLETRAQITDPYEQPDLINFLLNFWIHVQLIPEDLWGLYSDDVRTVQQFLSQCGAKHKLQLSYDICEKGEELIRHYNLQLEDMLQEDPNFVKRVIAKTYHETPPAFIYPALSEKEGYMNFPEVPLPSFQQKNPLDNFLGLFSQMTEIFTNLKHSMDQI